MSKCVLVVEDEPLIRLLVIDILSEAGFEVFEAQDPAEALTVLKSDEHIDVLLTDVRMPGSMDGLKLAAAVRDRWPPVKIIVTSGARTIEITDMPDGSVFFSKPYAHLAVIQSMRELLSI